MGRDAEMQELHGLLQRGDQVAIAAVGMGGVGKTTLARRYARAYQSEYPGGIWWVAAGRLVTEVLGCAGRSIGLESLDPGMDEAAIVRHYFGRWEAGFPGRKLLVLDDVGEFGAVKGYLPLSGAFQVLMTTRVRMQSPVSCLALGVLEPGAAVELLRELVAEPPPSPQFWGDKSIQSPPELGDLGGQFDVAAAQELCAWLGHLPLAIELVGRYLAETGTIASVLADLKARSLDAAAIDEVPDEMSYERNVRSAIGLSWEPLEERARRVLLMVSVFEIGPIELGWVQDCLPEMADVERILDRVLVKRSLLERREGRYQMHALVRAFLGGRMAADGERMKRMDGGEDLGRRFAGVMVAIAKTIPQVVTLEVQARVRGAVPQMEEVAAQWTEVLADDELHWCPTGLASFYESLNLWLDVERCCKHSLSISQERLGEDHPLTTLSLNNLATFYQSTGCYDQAEFLVLKALRIQKAVLGNRHPFTDFSLKNLAAIYHSSGRYEEAESLLTTRIELEKQETGTYDPNLVIDLNNLAGLYNSMGRYEEAESLFVKILSIRKSELGGGHPDTAISLHDLAVLYVSQGRYSEAEAANLEALSILKETLGSEHPDIANSSNSLALLYYRMGNHNSAEKLYSEALSIWKVALGDEHPNTLHCLSGLALLYEAMGRYDESETLYCKVLSTRRIKLGDKHPDTATSLNNLALLYYWMTRYNDAEPLYLEALKIRKIVLGISHPDTATSLNNLALLYNSMGRYQEAKLFYIQSLSIRRSKLRECHPDIAQSLNNLALLYHSTVDYQGAEPLYIEALAIKRSELGNHHPDTATTLNNLSDLYRCMGRYTDAEPLYLEALQICTDELGDKHPHTIQTRQNGISPIQI